MNRPKTTTCACGAEIAVALTGIPRKVCKDCERKRRSARATEWNRQHAAERRIYWQKELTS